MEAGTIAATVIVPWASVAVTAPLVSICGVMATPSSYTVIAPSSPPPCAMAANVPPVTLNLMFHANCGWLTNRVPFSSTELEVGCNHSIAVVATVRTGGAPALTVRNFHVPITVVSCVPRLLPHLSSAPASTPPVKP